MELTDKERLFAELVDGIGDALDIDFKSIMGEDVVFVLAAKLESSNSAIRIASNMDKAHCIEALESILENVDKIETFDHPTIN